MASLSRLGGNAHVAKRTLRMLSTHLPGRVVLRLGAAKWQANMTGGDFSKAVGSKASLQWAASRLWAAGQLLHSPLFWKTCAVPLKVLDETWMAGWCPGCGAQSADASQDDAALSVTIFGT